MLCKCNYASHSYAHCTLKWSVYSKKIATYATAFLIPCKNIAAQSDSVLIYTQIRNSESTKVSIAAIQFSDASEKNSR